MPDIEVTYWEGDCDRYKGGFLTRLVYAEWKRNGIREMAYAAPSDDPYRCTDDADGHIIPDDVREAIAYAVAPHLRRAG